MATNLGNTIQRENARNALRESELRERTRANELQTLLDSVPAAVWIAHDAACIQMTGNKASYEFLRMPLGTNPSRTGPDLGKTSHFRMLLNDTEITQDQLPMQICASTGQPFFNLEETIAFEDGTHIKFDRQCRALMGQRG